MSTAGIIKVSDACPVFDGTEYPYWKNKMRMHLEAIDVDLWYVVKNGVPKAGEGVTAADVKKFVQLDSTAKNIICFGCLWALLNTFILFLGLTY